jgi:tetratricopeptide (TPR) repeat protein
MSPNSAQIAEELLRQKKYDEAIQMYQRHIDERLKVEDRPEWENPYFYLILIGDIQMGTGDLNKALETFLDAEKKGVDRYLISDRIRSIAKAYEDKKEYDLAINLLLAQRERDSLLFEAMLDRVNKAKTLAEQD